MFDGFLGTRASLMLDVVFLAMFALIPAMGWSIYQVKFNRRYLLHKRVQLVLGAVLLATLALFEVDVQVYPWEQRANPHGKVSATVLTTLYIHLFFAITTAALWVFVIVQALRNIPNPPGPCPYSARHMFWAKLAAIDMCCTAVTGCLFYLIAFAAPLDIQ